MVAKFKPGDLVKLRGKIHASGCSVGVVTEVRQVEYVQTDATMTVVQAFFGSDELTLSENDFVLVRKIDEI
tara:strand:+ start:636 stop:848 length:213 start_codon:yes stop_codon:yes gene_type:complete